jgi:hypothetical protein
MAMLAIWGFLKIRADTDGPMAHSQNDVPEIPQYSETVRRAIA